MQPNITEEQLGAKLALQRRVAKPRLFWQDTGWLANLESPFWVTRSGWAGTATQSTGLTSVSKQDPGSSQMVE